MNNSLFTLQVVTPTKVFEKNILRIRLRDASGYFGIMKGHTDFITVLEPSLCSIVDVGGQESFFAIDGGIFRMNNGSATLTSRDVFESTDVRRLSEIISETVSKRDATETAFMEMIRTLERTFMEKTLELSRG